MFTVKLRIAELMHRRFSEVSSCFADTLSHRSTGCFRCARLPALSGKPHFHLMIHLCKFAALSILLKHWPGCAWYLSNIMSSPTKPILPPPDTEKHRPLYLRFPSALRCAKPPTILFEENVGLFITVSIPISNPSLSVKILRQPFTVAYA